MKQFCLVVESTTDGERGVDFVFAVSAAEVMEGKDALRDRVVRGLNQADVYDDLTVTVVQLRPLPA